MTGAGRTPWAAVAMVGVLAAWAGSAPQPKIVATEWELDATFESPRPIRVDIPGRSEAETFWYVLYTVVNNTAKEQVFVPAFSQYTDTGQLLADQEGVPSCVFDAIKRRHNNPLLMQVSDMTGPLLQGEDNAKDGVAIFRDIDPEARGFDLFVSGLSGEAVRLKLPTEVEVTRTRPDGSTRREMSDTILLKKTLRISYALPGEAEARPANRVRESERDWVMR